MLEKVMGTLLEAAFPGEALGLTLEDRPNAEPGIVNEKWHRQHEEGGCGEGCVRCRVTARVCDCLLQHTRRTHDFEDPFVKQAARETNAVTKREWSFQGCQGEGERIQIVKKEVMCTTGKTRVTHIRVIDVPC